MASYHTSSQTTSRTRAATHKPRRAYYVWRYLTRQLTPGKPKAISNKRIQEAIGFGSEGEVSQIMRWLSGEAPANGRWAYGALRDSEQRYRFLTRERMPSGGYLITLLPSPIPIDAPIASPPEAVQLSFLDDPPMIPPGAQQDAARGGSFSECDDRAPIQPRPARQNARSQGDHEKESHEETQEEEARAPLFDRLMAQPGMSRSLARRIAQHPIGSLAAFETDLAIARTFARSPFFFTVARWRDGQRVVAPEETDEQPEPRRSRAGIRADGAQPDRDGAAHPERGPVRTSLTY